GVKLRRSIKRVSLGRLRAANRHTCPDASVSCGVGSGSADPDAPDLDVAALVTLEVVKVTCWRKGLNPKQAHFTVAGGASHQRWDAGIVVVLIGHADNMPAPSAPRHREICTTHSHPFANAGRRTRDSASCEQPRSGARASAPALFQFRVNLFSPRERRS